MVGACGECGEEERYIHSFHGETWGERPLERPGCTWEKIVKFILKNLVGRAWT
jgi:hypothetical protein